MNGISAVIKEGSESSLSPSSMWGHNKKTAVCESGRGSPPDTRSVGTMILDFPTSRT